MKEARIALDEETEESAKAIVKKSEIGAIINKQAQKVEELSNSEHMSVDKQAKSGDSYEEID